MSNKTKELMKWQEIKQTARDLRKIETEEETFMWNVLRNRKVDNLKFNRQFPIIYETINNEHFFFVADFYCSQYKLILEVDGKIHLSKKDKDERRDKILLNMGFITLRIKNEELNDIDLVISKIKEFVKGIDLTKN